MSPVHKVRLTHDRIHFPNPHRARRATTLPTSAIRDADPTACPPQVRTLTGNTLFISATQATDLEHFRRRNRIPLIHRPDIWADLLEPFLDTEFTLEAQANTLARLHTSGLSPTDAAHIRTKLAPLMRAYNSLHWDWTHLSLADLLDAATAPWIPPSLRPTPADLPAFTTCAMQTADLPAHP
jgi:hypothetical protein